MKQAIGLMLLALAALPATPQSAPPRLEKRGKAAQLIVDGKPLLMLAGELGNNSSSSLEFMKAQWPRLAAMHLNTVLFAVSWAQIEPAEGKFDFAIVDGLIEDARRNNMRLVPLWFGSWKNTWSSYAPEWVKRDLQRFPRVVLANGQGTERLSPLSDACREADARAFAALMRHIKEFDGTRHTVVMVQVENEVGVIPDARDHSPAAGEAYRGPVPKELMDYLQKHRETLAPEMRARWQATGFKASGTWEEVFGPGLETEDLFMAWLYARYIGKVTAAGKAEYNLPMFVNAALIRPNYAPGQYNSGGPLPHSVDIWRAGGPQIDFYTPDIYFNFKEWSAKFERNGNPLFIPETRGGADGAANVFYAVGNHNAMGFSPFGIDFSDSPELGASYGVLSELAPLILEAQARGTIAGVVLEALTPSQKVRVGNYTLHAVKGRQDSTPYGLFIAAGPDEYYLAGSGLNITFAPHTPGPPIVGLGTVEEGHFVEGRWVRGRLLAGDDTGQGNNVSLNSGSPKILRVTVYRYK